MESAAVATAVLPAATAAAETAPTPSPAAQAVAPIPSATDMEQAPEAAAEAAAAAPVASTPAEPTTVDEPVEKATTTAVVAPAPTPEEVEPEEIVEEAASTAGITSDGRACNDPRVEAREVGVVEITTKHPVLFTDGVAPAVAPSGRIVTRASNDPRGPIAQDAVPEAAAGQS